MNGLTLALLVIAALAAPAAQPEEPPPPTLYPGKPPTPPAATPAPLPLPATPRMVEMLPGLRIDRDARAIEFDGIVPVDVHDPQTPKVYLELFVTGPDSREHEALVMTRVKPSAIHAGLLALGLSPGKPGVLGPGRDTPAQDPTGDQVTIDFITRSVTSGERLVEPATAWVINADDGSRLPPAGAAAEPGSPAASVPVWLFAGSRLRERRDPDTGRTRTVYDADGTGVIVGLHTFSSEVLAWPKAMSPDSAVLAPEWIADVTRVPAMGTPVTVRVRALGPKPEQK
jgi:hypothetical protein